MSSTQVSTRGHSFTRLRVRTSLVSAAVLGVCAPILAACSATGFGSPVRNAVANLQAATAKIGTNLEVQGVIVALPSGVSSPKGGLAYLQFNAINFANQQDGLVNVTVEAEASTSTGSASTAPSVASAAESLQAATDARVPAATAAGPGTARISILLRNLTAPLTQGESVVVGFSFAGGSISGLLVPVQGADVVGTFLPTAPPPPPASSPVASPVASPVGSPPAGSSAPVASAPASAPASPSAAASG